MQPFSRTESKIKTMNKLTSKEAIEKAVLKLNLPIMWSDVAPLANRVLDDMQEEVNDWKSKYYRHCDILELEAKLTTTRADTLKEVLDILRENQQAQIAAYYNYDAEGEERNKRNAVIEEYRDLILIVKSKLTP
jgi:hypothetical protein